MTRRRQALSRAGEEAAAEFLLRRGYRILERNYRCRAGEADLVVRQGGNLVFVEVKTRSGTGYGVPLEAVPVAKQRKLRQVARWYLAERGIGEVPVRFDVIGVLGRPGAFRIEHVRGAF